MNLDLEKKVILVTGGSRGIGKGIIEWEKQEAKRRGIPFGRFGKVCEITPIVSLLLSPLSSYISGSFIDAAGGLNMRG